MQERGTLKWKDVGFAWKWRNVQLAIPGGNMKILVWNPKKGFQIFAAFLLFILLFNLNISLPQLRQSIQSILLAVIQWQLFLAAVK